MGSDLATYPSTSVVNLSVDAVNWHVQILVDLVNIYPTTLRDGVTKYWLTLEHFVDMGIISSVSCFSLLLSPLSPFSLFFC